MTYSNTLLICLGFGGCFLLLGLGTIPRLIHLRRFMSALWITLGGAVFALSPMAGRWVLSVWAPSSVTSGLFVLEVTPEVWLCIATIVVSFGGILWVAVGERPQEIRFAGPLLVCCILILWLVLASGSLLMVLAMWSMFDIVWFLGRLLGTRNGEHVVWAVAVTGMASVLLWVVSLFLLREGASGLWWLMRPSSPSLTLLLVAACMRMGFYPFQVVHTEEWGQSRSLTLASVISPLLGVGLLYRLLLLPGDAHLPTWVLVWGALSVCWSGLKALSHDGRDALLPASYGLLLALVTGAVYTGDARNLLLSSGVWVAGLALLTIARRYSRQGFVWSWPTIVALLFLVGVPPSPCSHLYLGALTETPWVVLVLYLVGFVTSVAAVIRGSVQRAEGRVTPAYPHQWIPMAAGLISIVAIMLLVGRVARVPAFSPVPFALWGLATVGGFLLAILGDRVVAFWNRAHAVLDLLDVRWFYRSLWQGANNLLGVLRVTAEVVEGRGSVLWSVLILLLILMAVGGQ